MTPDLTTFCSLNLRNIYPGDYLLERPRIFQPLAGVVNVAANSGNAAQSSLRYDGAVRGQQF
jgi:hypothetical protein